MNEDNFLAALHESPGDDVTWLALADWLEEDGQSERAELVRIVRRLRSLAVMKRSKERATLEDRLSALLNAGVRPVVPEIVNSIGMRLALIPPGHFRMGSPKGEKNRQRNETAHSVTITRAFYLGVFPVTQGQYRSVISTNPSHFRRNGPGKNRVKGISRERLARFPVEMVTWGDAQTFLERLQSRESDAGLRYRLPTEAEWEYACRGGSASTGPFCYGDSLSPLQANFNGDFPYGSASAGINRQCPSEVGSFLPNAFGLYDMHGNVWEWCHDWYGEYASGPAIDPRGPTSGSDWVVRGAAWFDYAQHCRSAYRVGCSEIRTYHVGFRIAAEHPNG
jgi:uncharacterized protein (TIGR02996 family)